MKTTGLLIAIISLLVCNVSQAQKTYAVGQFDKLIVSPHIQVSIIKGDKEKVEIISNTEDEDKLNVEVKGKNLRIYLDDAKEVTKHEKVSVNGTITNRPIYNNTVVVAEVTYVQLTDLSIRGEETFVSKGPFYGDKIDLNIYGESKVLFDEVDLKDLDVNLYGEGYLEIKSGKILEQQFTAFGESRVNMINVENDETKLTAYGDAQFEVNTNNRLKITSYGDPTINYKGNPEVTKGITLGGVTIKKIDN